MTPRKHKTENGSDYIGGAGKSNVWWQELPFIGEEFRFHVCRFNGSEEVTEEE